MAIMSNRFSPTVVLAVLLCWTTTTNHLCTAFVSRTNSNNNAVLPQPTRSSSSVVGKNMDTTLMYMGLYDTPLPPPPAPRDRSPPPGDDDDNDDDEEEEEEEDDFANPRLFSFNKNGKEVNNLLPPLGRSLEFGIDCYFEETDRKVINLVGNTGCRTDDAAWALEACRGDVTEAWTRISMARRMNLDQSRVKSSLMEEEDWDEDSNEVEVEEEFQERKTMRLEDEKKQQGKDFFNNLLTDQGKDSQWLPTKNPTPIDDEPWFTG